MTVKSGPAAGQLVEAQREDHSDGGAGPRHLQFNLRPFSLSMQKGHKLVRNPFDVTFWSVYDE